MDIFIEYLVSITCSASETNFSYLHIPSKSRYLCQVKSFAGNLHGSLMGYQFWQVQGKFYVKIDPLGEGSRWRRTFGQEIYSPLLVAFSIEVIQRLVPRLISLMQVHHFCFLQDGGNWTGSHTANFSAMDPSYSLPDNVALITLQVCDFSPKDPSRGDHSKHLILIKLKQRCLLSSVSACFLLHFTFLLLIYY